MNARLEALAAAGQSIWLDNIRRSMFASGELRDLISAGLRGMTSNPTIFEKAIGSGNDYDEQLASLAGSETDPNRLFEALAIQDIRSACDEFRGLYDATHGGDGYVSLEVSPLLAHDTDGTIAAAKRLWAAVDRPNVMIKIPGTPEGVPAITDVIAAGINVNVTLLFSTEQYEAAADAYIAGIERRVAGRAAGRPRRVGRQRLRQPHRHRGGQAARRQDRAGRRPQDTAGKGRRRRPQDDLRALPRAVRGGRFAKLRERGAHVQRPLWASTSTKNPAYPELMYVETVVGPDTVNTLPPATLDALMDRGTVVPDTVESDLPGARAELEHLAGAGISLADVTHQLQVEGVASFAASYDAMLAAISGKHEQLAGAVAAKG